MGLLDIEQDDDPPAAPKRKAKARQKPKTYTLTLQTIWDNHAEKVSNIRFVTGIFEGTDLDEIAQRAIEAAAEQMAEDDGFVFASADVVSMIEGAHDNLAMQLADSEEDES